MRWLGLVFVTVAVAAFGTLLLRGRRAGDEKLGSVSESWIAEHRADSL
jgi:hypothetical protein